ncbi:MAG TPA: DUF3037 domain-containing protein [Candidatus Acidoferrum sp.]|jgi:hypothetical protein|nr:DUF3037 domain-containing protein [Candidatus Acidoferrum sp.]
MPENTAISTERICVYVILRYTPNLVRDEWVNIGVLLFDRSTGERRLRLLEDQEEFARVRRLHPGADEGLLRGLRDDLEDRLRDARHTTEDGDWQKLLAKWEDTLSNALQLAPQKGVFAEDLDAELERLYADHVAPQRAASRVGAAGSRAFVRNYCAQVWKLANLWGRLEKSVPVREFTFPGDPMRIDYGYRRNGTRGFVQTLSVSRAPADCKLLAYTAARMAARAPFGTEFAAVTDVPLLAGNERHVFVRETLRDAGIEPVPMEGFAVWVAKLRPMLQ